MNGPAPKGTKLRVVNLGCPNSMAFWGGARSTYDHITKHGAWLRSDYDGKEDRLSISFNCPGYEPMGNYTVHPDDFEVLRKTIVIVEE